MIIQLISYYDCVNFITKIIVIMIIKKTKLVSPNIAQFDVGKVFYNAEYENNDVEVLLQQTLRNIQVGLCLTQSYS